MTRKIIVFLVSLSLMLTLVVGCTNKSSTESETKKEKQETTEEQMAEQTTGKGLKEVSVNVFRPKEMSQDYSDNLFTDFIKEKFNMNLIFEYSPSSAYKEKLNLLFATGQYPDAIEFIDTVTINRLARDGFILPISDYIDKLPNYKNAFTAEDWDKQVKLLSNARGKWFALEIKWPESAMGTNVWMYRIKEFEKQDISLPKTTDDLYQAMKKFKEVNPNATIPNRWGVMNAIEGFNMAYRVQTDIWLDPDVKDIVYGPATEKYRDLMKYMNRLFKEGILAKEFATMTGEQRTAEFTKGNVYVNYQFPGAENALNEWLKSNNLEPDWAWSKDALLLTAYSDKKPMQQRYKITTDFGTAITDKLEGEELDRYLSFLNWAASEEGQIFYEFGIKGVTYDIIDGRPQYIGKAKDETDPDSYLGNIENFGPFGYYLIQNEAHAKTCYPLYSEINESTAGLEYYDYTPLAYRHTPEEEDIVADAGTVVNDVRDEYMLKFIMGTKDPGNDNDWNEYMDKLKKAGLEKYHGTKKDAYNRMNK